MSLMDEEIGPKRLRQSSILEAFSFKSKSSESKTPTGNLDIELVSKDMSTSTKNHSSLLAESSGSTVDEKQSPNDSGFAMAATSTLSLSPGNPQTSTSSHDNFVDSDETNIDFTPPLFTNSESPISDESEANQSLGTPLSEMRKTPQCSLPLPTLKADNYHTILFKVKNGNNFEEPFPERYVDRWDENHVRMPCSPQNLYPVLSERTGEKHLEDRWTLILRALNKDITNSKGLEDAILSYNARYKERWNFYNLHRFFDQMDERESTEFFRITLPKMIRLAIRLPELVTGPIPLLKQGRTHIITMNQTQAASLLANAFFCTFPRRNTSAGHSEYINYPRINFAYLFNRYRHNDKQSNCQVEKIKSVIHYFRRITTNEPRGTLSFKRQHVSDSIIKWKNSNRQFPRLHITSEGTIEDGVGMLQVDFANKFIGGGVLARGCVQEEIRFVICPELIVSMLFTEKMNNNECVIITGCERFSLYSGYSDGFKWSADYMDTTPRDEWGRRVVDIVAMDATMFNNARQQYAPEWLERETNKAYCGFYCPDTRPENLSAVATGNWGCGAFRGEPRLKAVLQMMAAAEVGRDVVYFTFGQAQLCQDINALHQFILNEKHATVGTIFRILKNYHSILNTKKYKKALPDLYEFLRHQMSYYDSDTDIEQSISNG